MNYIVENWLTNEKLLLSQLRLALRAKLGTPRLPNSLRVGIELALVHRRDFNPKFDERDLN